MLHFQSSSPKIDSMKTYFLLLAICQLFVLIACHTVPEKVDIKPYIEPVGLIDLTDESDFQFDGFEPQLDLISEYEQGNNRAAAAAIISAIDFKLTGGQQAEKQYLQLRLAALWAASSEGQDLPKTDSILTEFEPVNKRIAGEYSLLQFRLLETDSIVGKKHADECLAAFESIQAYRAYVSAGRVISNRYSDDGQIEWAKEIIDVTLDVSSRLKVSAQHLYVCLDVGALYLEDNWFNQAYLTALKLDDDGWKTVVVATVTDFWFNENQMKKAASWGGRIRDTELGKLPETDESGLWPEDYALLLAQYGLALAQSDPKNHRLKEILTAAKGVMQGLPDDAGERAKEWQEKLDAALLQAVGD